MRSSSPISTLSKKEAGREDYSRGLIRRYFFPFVPRKAAFEGCQMVGLQSLLAWDNG